MIMWSYLRVYEGTFPYDVPSNKVLRADKIASLTQDFRLIPRHFYFVVFPKYFIFCCCRKTIIFFSLKLSWLKLLAPLAENKYLNFKLAAENKVL